MLQYRTDLQAVHVFNWMSSTCAMAAGGTTQHHAVAVVALYVCTHNNNNSRGSTRPRSKLL